MSGPAPKHRKKRSAAERELERLRKRNAKLEDQLASHKQALEIQGKASELLARLLAESADTDRPSSSRLIDEAFSRSSPCSAPRRPVRPSGGPGPATTASRALPHHRAKAPARPAQQARRRRGRRHPGRAALAPLRRLFAGPGVLHPPRRRHLSGRESASTGSCGPTTRCASGAVRPPTRPR